MKLYRTTTVFFATFFSTALIATAFAAPKIDRNIPAYEKVAGISGNLSSVGSDTLANLVTLWSEEFKRIYPSVNIQIQAAGSSTAPPSLTEGTANVGPMSRKMKSKEEESFEKRHGYKAMPIRVAIDALAVFVHKDNPIKGVNIEQLDGIFSSTRKCGAAADITQWGQLGIGGSLGQQHIQLFGRNSVSGTYGYFKSKVTCKGDFKDSVNEQPGSASVVQSVSTSLNAMGYSGIGYRTTGVRAVSLAKGKTNDYIVAKLENVMNGSYPLARFLYIYVNKHPNKPLPPLELAFLRLVLSSQGQKIVIKDGYIPLPAHIVAQDLAKLH